jgi:hypothetical protein
VSLARLRGDTRGLYEVQEGHILAGIAPAADSLFQEAFAAGRDSPAADKVAPVVDNLEDRQNQEPGALRNVLSENIDPTPRYCFQRQSRTNSSLAIRDLSINRQYVRRRLLTMTHHTAICVLTRAGRGDGL